MPGRVKSIRRMQRKKYKTNLSLCRARKRLSQTIVATLDGLPQSKISEFEKGIKLPTLRTAVCLAVLYDVTVEILLGEFYAEQEHEAQLFLIEVRSAQGRKK